MCFTAVTRQDVTLMKSTFLNGPGCIVVLCMVALACQARATRPGLVTTQSRTTHCRLFNGEWRVLESGITPVPNDTLLSIQTVHNAASDTVWAEWIADHHELRFGGERYFCGPEGMQVWQFEIKGNHGRLISVGEHDGVTVYAWDTPASSLRSFLYFRTDANCGIQKYLHVSQVQN